MKKTVKILSAVLVSLIVLLSVTGCSVIDKFTVYNLDDVMPAIDSGDQFHTLYVSAVELASASLGEKITLTGEDVENFYMNFEGVQCSREEGDDTTGAMFSLTFKFADGRADTKMYIISGTEFVYEGYTYTSLNGSVNTDFLNIIVKDGVE